MSMESLSPTEREAVEAIRGVITDALARKVNPAALLTACFSAAATTIGAPAICCGANRAQVSGVTNDFLEACVTASEVAIGKCVELAKSARQFTQNN